MSSEVPQSGGEPDASAAPARIRPLWSRAVALVTAPRSVFEELRVKPSWIGATVLLALFSLVIGLLIYDSVIYPMMLDQAQQQATTSEQLARAEELYASPVFRIFIAAMGPASNFVFVIVTGLLFYAACGMIMGGRTTVKRGFAVAAHSYLVLIPRALVLLPIMFSKQDARVSLGPGVLFPQGEAIGFAQNFIASFLAGLDLFNLWALALSILGMSVVAQLPTRRVGTVFVVGYLVIILAWSLLAGVTGPK